MHRKFAPEIDHRLEELLVFRMLAPQEVDSQRLDSSDDDHVQEKTKPARHRNLVERLVCRENGHLGGAHCNQDRVGKTHDLRLGESV